MSKSAQSAKTGYRYNQVCNPIAFAAVGLGVAPNMPGFLHAAAPGMVDVGALWLSLYTYAWFVGFAIAGVVYAATMLMLSRSARTRPHPA